MKVMEEEKQCVVCELQFQIIFKIQYDVLNMHVAFLL